MSMENKCNRPKPLTNTQRTRRRKALLKIKGVTELRVETCFVEKELLKRLARVSGYNGVTEYVIMRAIEHGRQLGVTPEAINLETRLLSAVLNIKKQVNTDS